MASVRGMMLGNNTRLANLNTTKKSLKKGSTSVKRKKASNVWQNPNQSPPVVGIDEVGRGAFAGPVVVCACYFAPEAWEEGTLNDLLPLIDDSKALSKKKREELASALRRHKHVKFAFGQRPASDIDTFGIQGALFSAMQEAYASILHAIKSQEHQVIIDGNQVIELSQNVIPISYGPSANAGSTLQKTTAIEKADSKIKQVAAASILAKVARDATMAQLGSIEANRPYNWESNSGYGVRAHIKAIQQIGPSQEHRKAFISNYCQG